MTKRGHSAVLGAAFLMATSAIGPGFLTQTAKFTGQLGASFGFAILVSIVFDLVAQLTIWRVLIGTGLRGQVAANGVLPGLGFLLSLLVSLGGLAFNIGNVAGAGLGLNVIFGLDVRVGAAVSAAIGIALFLSKDAGRAMDWFAQLLGGLMVLVAGYVAVAAGPPVGEAVLRTVAPTRIDPGAIVTIVGGTVGGYITFAGAHRLLDAGLSGPAAIPLATRSASLGIGVASVMRVVLFLGALGVVSRAGAAAIDPANPPASVFRAAAGELGYRFFGVVMWAAAITSVVGSAFTSVSFLKTLRASWERAGTAMIVGFIALSTVIFLVVGNPVKVLIVVGAINGMILPVGLATMVVVSRQAAHRDQVGLHPALAGAALLVAVAMAELGRRSIVGLFQ
jgi:Mn2+/Fe2+ NRAMP family transporter